MMKDELIAHFAAAPSAPFLFVGSGFSRRYLGLEDWSGILQRFTTNLKPYEYYVASGGGYLPRVARMVAADFHDYWWAADEYKASRDKNKSKAKDITSALRIELCNYLLEKSKAKPAQEYVEEIALLSRLNVDGIVTTNWDILLESLFPDYKVFIGQNELIFSNTQMIGEIYKIHGSATRPSSLVLTDEDYRGFEAANPYLAAKLITIFVEHPVVFIGYSLTDPNVTALLRAITHALGTDNIAKLQNNLIFVQRAGGKPSQYSKTIMAIDGGQLPITIVQTDSLVPIYVALEAVKRKIPARVLRYCKQQLYELVRNTKPSEKLCLVDIDEIEEKSNVEFVIGVGVATEKAGQLGYQGIATFDLFGDLVQEKSKFDPKAIITTTIPGLGRSATFLPVFRYLHALGIDSAEDYQKSGFKLEKHIPAKGAEHYWSKQYGKQFLRTEKDKTAAEIIGTNPPEKAAIFLPFLPKERFDLNVVSTFLREHLDRFDTYASYGTFFRKLACLYDLYAFGWSPVKPAAK
jgi:hypothetical protein